MVTLVIKRGEVIKNKRNYAKIKVKNIKVYIIYIIGSLFN